jgi:hypothetical protein
LAYSAEHVHYEVDIFFETVDLRFRPAYAAEILKQLGHPQRINNALIESFVIHLRNLIDFLDLPAQGTDVVAEDFFSPGGWVANRPKISQTLGDAKRRANKEISHLTTARMSGAPPERIWHFAGLASELKPLLVRFCQNADKGRLAAVVEGAIR